MKSKDLIKNYDYESRLSDQQSRWSVISSESQKNHSFLFAIQDSETIQSHAV